LRFTRSTGVTLIEVVVVLLLIGLTSALATGVVHSWRRSDGEVDRLALALEMAAERARIRGTPIRFEPLPQGYRFSRLDTSGNWQPVLDDPLLAERGLPADIAWRHLTRDGQEVVGGLVFGSDVPLYTLEIGSPSGTVQLVGQPSGTLQSRFSRSE
jgi:type II secretion system protein H